MKFLEVLKKAKTMLSSVKLSQEPLDNGTVIEYDGDAIVAGSVIYVQDSAGDWSVIADGKYTTKAGFKFTVKEGVVESTEKTEEKEKEVVEEKKDEVKQEEEKLAEEVTVETVATIDLAKLVEEKLAPVWEQIYAIKSLVEASQKLNNETQQSLSKVTDTVALLAKQPSAKEIDEKEVGGIKKVDPKLKESRLYKIFNSQN